MSAFVYHHGPDMRADGVVFRLWAPEARSVALELEGDMHHMRRSGDGWVHSEPLPAVIGARYGFRINDDLLVPDPASRQQEDDVHGRSVVCGAGGAHGDNGAQSEWRNRSWAETVLYELHTGTFTPEGTFRGVAAELPRLRELGITAVELMPVADFPGRWNWGYDGVLPFAPDRRYGTPKELHDLVESAHRHGLALWLDVVYNHFGPEGNYLHLYAPQFFSDSINTPWGPGIDFTRPAVRQFFIENAVYWTREFGVDGLRLDAVHAIEDPSERDGGLHILDELAATVRRAAPPGKTVHLVLENDRNQARFLSTAAPGDSAGVAPSRYSGQWNDDIHHAFHILLTGETFGYYKDYADRPEHHLVRALAEGYVYQGDISPGSGEPRGEPSTHLSPTRFIAFLQNHDQIGNRAWGERLRSLASPEALEAAISALLLSPQTPLLFMGEEVGAETPFQFFCDFHDELAEAVRAGRRREFGLDDIPDPIAKTTVDAGVPGEYPENRWTALYRTLLTIRRRELVPLLPRMVAGTYTERTDTAPVVTWSAGDTRWRLAVNLSATPRALPESPRGVAVYPADTLPVDRIPRWTTAVWKETTT
ncbi:MAG: malto-oligosyltrehalose trehalohydrolase [Spirochaeta sp.]|jgi:maltooligosyltrehalose trehalohydrolase|nr:malto-oligosyltrehalose trehalohydrolase [Spirochaeta sp.]